MKSGEDDATIPPDGTPDDEASRANTLFDPVSLADFEQVDLNVRFAEVRRIDRRALLDVIREESARAADAGDAAAIRVYRLLATIIGLHLRTDSEGDPFGVQHMDADRRSAIPFDFAGEQSGILAAIAPGLTHPTLRARVADIAYENGQHRAGQVAIDAYCEIVKRIAEKNMEPEFEGIDSRVMDMVKPIERSFMINARIAKRGTVVSGLIETLTMAVDHAHAEREYFPFAQLGERLLYAKARPADEIAAAAEELASTAKADDYQLAVKEVWNLAASAHRLGGDEDASHAASVKAIEQTLAMAGSVTGSSAQAHWVKNALREFRSLGNCLERVAELRLRLRDLQDRALDEYGSYSTPLDGLSEMREETIEHFSALALPEAMRAILGYLEPEDVDTLNTSILDMAREFPLSNLMSSSYSDDEGREIARGSALSFDDAPDDDWFKEQATRHLAIHRRFLVHGQIEPARGAVLQRFSVNQQHLIPIVQLSPFVPPTHRLIFSLGLARLWQGDYVTAGHLLIPQVENSLRHVLKLSGRDSGKIEADGIEGDRPLNILFSYCRADLEAIFGARMIWHLDTLLNFRPGPALRHQLAHGKMNWSSFYSDEAVIACWTVYLLTVVPVLRLWESHVEPALNAMTGAEEI